MTLIAGFFKDECPILMGDLLVSAPDNSDTEIVFPTIGKISNKHLSNGKYRPTRLCQKVNLLSPKLAIAWAGTKIYAGCFMREIIAANLHNNPTRDSLREVFNRIGGQGRIFIIGVYRNGKEMCIFDFNARPIDPPVPGFGWFKAEGSGYGTLLGVVSNLGSSVITSGQPNKLDSGISTAVLISTELISQEIQTALPLQNLFGAGYEILHPLGSDLVKFCDLTYLFWRAEEEAQGIWRILPFPFLASKYTYHGDILVIRSVRVSSNIGTVSCKIDSDELHVIKPLYRSVRDEELVGYTPASLNSKQMCNVFLWKNHRGDTGAFATYGHYATQSPPVIWSNEFKSNEGVDINAQFVQSSISKIALHFKGDRQNSSDAA